MVPFEMDYLDIDPQLLGSGLAQWEVARGDLDGTWQAAVAEVRACLAGDPWGDDTAGAAFRNAYHAAGGPEPTLDRGAQCVADVGELGSLVRTSAENARGMDAEQARAVRNLLRRL